MKPGQREKTASEIPSTPGERPEVYAIRRGSSGWEVSRRGLFGAAAAAAAARSAPGATCPAGAGAHDMVRSLTFSPDGRLLASTGNESVSPLKLWSMPDGAMLKALAGGWTAPAISPDGRLMASGTGEYASLGAIRLWSLPDGTLLKTLTGHSGSVRAFAISADGRVLATSGDDKTMRLWSLPDGTPLKTFAVEYTPSILTFSPDGTRLAGSIPRLKGGALRLWSLPDGQLLTSFAGQADTVNSIALSPDWSLLATVDDDATIRVWSMPGLTLLKTLSQKTWGYDAAAAVISPNGRLVASMSDDGTIRLWSLPDGAQFKSMKAHTFGGYLAISPDGLVLASAGDSTFDTSIKLWSLPDGKQLPACLMDPSSSSNAAAGVTYTVEGVTYTIPAGAPLPAGAICTCNTVKGSYSTGGCSSFGVYYYPN